MPRKRFGKPFEKGKSGNPGGRPKEINAFRELCRAQTVDALLALKAALKDPDHGVAAAKALLEFAWGKAPQEIKAEVSLSTKSDEELRAELAALRTSDSTSVAGPK